MSVLELQLVWASVKLLIAYSCTGNQFNQYEQNVGSYQVYLVSLTDLFKLCILTYTYSYTYVYTYTYSYSYAYIYTHNFNYI